MRSRRSLSISEREIRSRQSSQRKDDFTSSKDTISFSRHSRRPTSLNAADFEDIEKIKLLNKTTIEEPAFNDQPPIAEDNISSNLNSRIKRRERSGK